MFNDQHSSRHFANHMRRFARSRGGDEGGFEDRGGRHHGGHGHHHDHHEHAQHRGRGRGGLGRFFAHGDLRLVVLNLINESPRHGYEIIKAIEESVGGAYTPSPGVIYPTLTLLDELGYVTVGTQGESSKKLYTVTDEGKAFLAANRKTLDALLSRIQEAGAQHRTGDAPQIVRATQNLKLALRLKLHQGALTEEQINAVAAAIDAAALAVEKA